METRFATKSLVQIVNTYTPTRFPKHGQGLGITSPEETLETFSRSSFLAARYSQELCKPSSLRYQACLLTMMIGHDCVSYIHCR